MAYAEGFLAFFFLEDSLGKRSLEADAGAISQGRETFLLGSLGRGSW